jgi:hypothetical protein
VVNTKELSFYPAETKKPKVEKIKKRDAILWEIKYFKLISLEKKR